MMEDRSLAPDIEAAAARIGEGALSALFKGLAGMPALWVPA
jgi:hypothetical protein